MHATAIYIKTEISKNCQINLSMLKVKVTLCKHFTLLQGTSLQTTNLSVSIRELSNLEILFNKGGELYRVPVSVFIEPSKELTSTEALLDESPLMFRPMSGTLC